MTRGGTAAYERDTELPELVRRAVELARTLDFELSCLPEQGRLLQVLVRGRIGARIGETGTGCGVGLAWMASAADPSSRLVSIERDPSRADAARSVFADSPNVEVHCGDWRMLLDHGPFDVLVLDGGGSGKGEGDESVAPSGALRPGGTIVIDDFTPRAEWPPVHLGRFDVARLHWLEHPDLLTTEIQVAPTMVTLLGTLR
jgi:predicted O-methyltransferase YrrM